MIDWDSRTDSIHGCLLGTAVGDALGLPYEGLSPRRAGRMLGPPDRYRFFFGRGMVSDDTDHAMMTAVALLQSRKQTDAADGDAGVSPDRLEPFEIGRFEAVLVKQLKWWLASIPAGIGLATLRSILKLWLGWSPATSGVFSAGNGPAMRAPILGAVINDIDVLKAFVRCSTRMTHLDPKAEYGAIVVAIATHLAVRVPQITGQQFLEIVREHLPSDAAELLTLLARCVESVSSMQSTHDFARSLGLQNGVTGYMYHTVPVCIHAWLSFSNDFESAIRCVIECGGDADTTAAITGGIVGAAVGAKKIPAALAKGLFACTPGPEFVSGMFESRITFPNRVLADNWCFRVLRNVFLFLPIVLFHGFRRTLPPY